jgi:hypothetical protein
MKLLLENWRQFLDQTTGMSNAQISTLILEVFKERFKKYLQDKPLLSNFINVLDKEGIKWGVTGGGVRDLLLNLPLNDVDIVADCTDKELEKIIEDNNIEVGKINRFGGRKLRLDPHTELVDVWTVGTTWGVRKGYVKNTGLGAYPEATTYSTDAVIVSPSSDEIYADHLIDSIKSQKINIVFGKTPIAISTLEKMYRLVKKYGLQPGEDALKFANLIKQKQLSSSDKEDFEVLQEDKELDLNKEEAEELLSVFSLISDTPSLKEGRRYETLI